MAVKRAAFQEKQSRPKRLAASLKWRGRPAVLPEATTATVSIGTMEEPPWDLNPPRLHRKLLAEGLGSVLLAATVVGSGIMAQRLAGGNVAIALLANTGATVAVLVTLIMLLGPVSGAHLNPAVSLIEAIRGRMTWVDSAVYCLVQVTGCCAGTLLAHAMFEMPLWQTSIHTRTGPAQWLAEGVATFGLLLVVLGHRRSEDAPWMVAGWIGAAYWFTASTSFANPAITIARSLSDTFAGIRPGDVPAFIVAQFIGAVAALLISRVLFSSAAPTRHNEPQVDFEQTDGKRGILDV
jgi:glycerol uptake facilitator-like aquaporin